MFVRNPAGSACQVFFVDKVQEARIRNDLVHRLSSHLGCEVEPTQIDRLVAQTGKSLVQLHTLDDQALLGQYQKHNGGAR